MRVEMLVGLKVTNEEGYAEYRRAMKPLLFAAGGGFGCVFRVSEVLLAPGEAVVELGDDAGADGGAEGTEGPRLLGDRDPEEGLAVLSYLSTLGHEAEAVEVHVGSGEDGHEPSALPAGTSPRPCPATSGCNGLGRAPTRRGPEKLGSVALAGSSRR